MIRDVFDIDNFNVISDDNYYYFFRALNLEDNNDLDNNITIDQNNNIFRIRTDRERYEDNPKYNEYSNLTLEEIFDHIKMHHRKDTNCISLTSNANVAIMYGREFYKDKYVIIKIPKIELGKDVVNAGFYMLNEVNNTIDNLINNSDLDNNIVNFLSLIENTTNQEELNNVINYIKNSINNYEFDDSIYEKGIEFTTTNSLDYNALNDEQNFYKNKTIAKLDIINKNIIKNISNKFLIQTIGNAFSSLELIHYNDISRDKIIEVPKEIVDIFSLIQQLPKDNIYVEELKKELLNNINNFKISDLTNFNYGNFDLNIDEEYTIENIYNLTKGTYSYIDFYDLYKKSFYLSKSRLRAINSVNNLNKVLGNPKFFEVFSSLENNTFGVEPKIFTRLTSNKLKISESVSIDITNNEKELFNFINKLNKEQLDYIINNPLETLRYYLDNFKFERINLDKETYYATSIVELFDWKSLGILNLSSKHKNNIINKLKECNVVDVYNHLKSKGIKEKNIANVLLTIVIKDQKIFDDMNFNDTFTLEELEDFLGYYQLKGTKLKLRSYQVSAKQNIDKGLSTHNFTSAILPTGVGKSFVALAEMLKYNDKDILYLAPNDEILNQIEDYIIEYIYGYKNTLTKNKKEIIKEIFPNLKLCTYSSLLSFNQKEIIYHNYDFIIFDELHRTGAKEWNRKILELINNQSNNTKFLGITATPQRDSDFVNMADYWAKYFGYTEEEIIKGEHIAINMELEDAIKLGYIVNPKVVECEYSSLENGGLLDNLLEKIKNVQDEDKRNILIRKHDVLRRKVNTAKGIEQIIGDNLKLGDKIIVFCPTLNKEENTKDKDLSNSINTINKYIQQIKEYLMTYYNKSEEEIYFIVEFNSMLSDYSKSKNKRQLQLFEQDNKNKIKFMVVIDKLNEGLHINGVNKLIWFRPLDENSKILMLQQFGRIIKSKSPNKEVYEEDRPMAIDLVGNIVRVNLNKKEKIISNDLDKMKLAINWLDLNNKTSEINNFDKVGRIYGRSLKKIKDKYLPFVDNNNLLEDLNDEEKIITLEILRLGNDIDLWNYDFSNISNEEKNDYSDLDDDLDIFELTGVLKDFIDLDEEVYKIYNLSLEEKIEELINSIKELKRLPKRKERNNGISEKVFSDGTDQRIYYDKLQKIYKNINMDIPLSNYEKDIIKNVSKINKYLNNINITFEEKHIELLKSIKELGRLPRDKKSNGGKSEKVFTNGADQKYYYVELQRRYNLIDFNKPLTDKEKQIVIYYKEVNEALKQFEVTSKEKKDELIKSIKELGRLPRRKIKNIPAERVFKNQNDQRKYYDRLKSKYDRIDFDKKLSDKEKKIIQDYEEINFVLSQYQEVVSDNEKREELIKTIRELGRLPIIKRYNNGIAERQFRDGTDQKGYFNNLKTKYDRIDFSKELTERERRTVYDYEEIVKELKKFVISISDEERKIELIKSIKELGRLPKLKQNNGGIEEKIFSDGIDQRGYFERLKKSYKKIDLNNPLSDKEKKIIQDYEEITLFLENRTNLNSNNIINLCNYYNIDISKNKSLLKKSCNEVYTKICYLIDNNISICDNNGIVHEIFFMSDINMQAKYNISFKELIEKYVYDSNKFRVV